ncbi:EpsG family protein [Cellulophaga baltica]|uniref:EpsG family protein n=1 Tax=Cellulophaga baltica TaxID=76594 RepID=UPI0024944AB1|nr:EpsG family protein [Cellulophaga baltica]
MLTYLITYISIFIVSLLEVIKKEKGKLTFAFFFIVLVLLAGLRGNQGIDTPNYLQFFKDVNTNKASLHNLELGFLYFSSIIKTIFNDKVFYFLIIATMSIGLKMNAIWKISPLPLFSSAILFGTYFLALETNQIRQGIALGFCFLALVYRIKDKKKNFFIAVFIASCFHVSAIVFSLAWILKRKINPKMLFSLVLFSLLFVFISMEVFIKQTIVLYFFWNDFIFEKLINYASKMNQVGFSPIHIWYLFISIFLLYYSKFIKHKVFNLLLNIFIMGVIFNFFLNSFSYMLRITYYFLAVEGLLIGMVLYHSKHLTNRLVLWSFVLLLTLFKNYSYLLDNIKVYE